jgi:5-formyltetrahydrofolate cyclo-ligase
MYEGTLLRQEILKRRDQQSIQDQQHKSDRIRATLLRLDDVKRCSSIFIYVSFRSEVQTSGIIDYLLGQGKTVSVPLTRVAEKRLEIIQIKAPQRELVPGYCGIPEPKEELAVTSALSAESLDLIILPGSVFDERGGRYGYGGGYYDRLLARVPAARRIALAYEMQIVKKLPLQPHDELLDLIVTEERLIRPPSRPLFSSASA